jgi:dTDP-glucose 4,6-dehydratase
MIECAKEILSVTGSSSGIVFQPLPEDDPMRRRPDIAMARTQLGWEPKVSLHEGLEQSLGYFKQCVGAA